MGHASTHAHPVDFCMTFSRVQLLLGDLLPFPESHTDSFHKHLSTCLPLLMWNTGSCTGQMNIKVRVSKRGKTGHVGKQFEDEVGSRT